MLMSQQIGTRPGHPRHRPLSPTALPLPIVADYPKGKFNPTSTTGSLGRAARGRLLRSTRARLAHLNPPAHFDPGLGHRPLPPRLDRRASKRPSPPGSSQADAAPPSGGDLVPPHVMNRCGGDRRDLHWRSKRRRVNHHPITNVDTRMRDIGIERHDVAGLQVSDSDRLTPFCQRLA